MYQVDAFSNRVFSGNPAAVCPLDTWLSDDIMLKIAAENNLAETAFYVKQQNQFEIRWFTPSVEVDLCGHATLASAFILFNVGNYAGDIITFYSPRSGELTVYKSNEYLTLNFPTDIFEQVVITNEMLSCFDRQPHICFKGKTDYLYVFDTEEDIAQLKPDFSKIAQLNARGVIVTAKGKEVDFVSRFFGPQVGIQEDPATGSAHTTLTPYWSKQLNKTELTAIQLSDRKGYFKCRYLNDRVEISGQATLYLSGEINLE